MNPENPPPAAVFIQTSAILVDAVDRALREKQKLPGLILLYTSLDIFAAISRPTTQMDTSGPVFMGWIDAYMLPYPPLRCSAMDLWGARCGLLHTFTTESRKSREGHARELAYIDNDNAADHLQQADPHCEKHVVVGIPSLMRAFVTALKNFSTQLQTDASLRIRAEHHLKNFVLTEALTAAELENFKKKFS